MAAGWVNECQNNIITLLPILTQPVRNKNITRLMHVQIHALTTKTTYYIPQTNADTKGSLVRMDTAMVLRSAEPVILAIRAQLPLGVLSTSQTNGMANWSKKPH